MPITNTQKTPSTTHRFGLHLPSGQDQVPITVLPGNVDSSIGNITLKIEEEFLGGGQTWT